MSNKPPGSLHTGGESSQQGTSPQHDRDESGAQTHARKFLSSAEFKKLISWLSAQLQRAFVQSLGPFEFDRRRHEMRTIFELPLGLSQRFIRLIESTFHDDCEMEIFPRGSLLGALYVVEEDMC